MAKYEEVLKGLECCIKESDHMYSNPCDKCPFEGKECIDRLKVDALKLLKKQQEKIEKAKLWLSASGVDLDAMCKED